MKLGQENLEVNIGGLYAKRKKEGKKTTQSRDGVY
jgi:hypothetical protein